MKGLQASFEKLWTRFEKKRSGYQQQLNRFKSQMHEQKYQHGHQLFSRLVELGTYLKNVFAQGADFQERRKVHSSVQEFKNTLKELHEFTKPVWRQWVEAIVIAGLLAFVLRTYVFGLYHVPTGSAEKNILVGDRIWGNKFIYYVAPIKRGDLVIFDKPHFVYDQSNPFKYFWQKYIALPLPFLGLGDVPQNWVKRVVGVPGDTIEGRIENGKTAIYLNGEKLDEPYVNPFPLIRVKKEIGFFKNTSFGPFAVPSLLRKQTNVRNYTYDPTKSLEDQPYYKVYEHELVKNPGTGEYIFEHPGTPNYNYFGASYDSFGPFKIPAGKYWVMGDSRKNSEDSRYWGFLNEQLVHGRASFIIFSIDSEEAFWLFELIKHPLSFWKRSVRWNRFFKMLH